MPIHGLIGYDLFKDFIVDINYSKKYIKLTNPDRYEPKSCIKCENFTLEFHNNKPYFNVSVSIKDKNIPVKLLIDSGNSDALWLFENDSLGINVKDNFFHDFLGHGLSGSLHGKRSKVNEFKLKSFTLSKSLVTYPDLFYTTLLRKIGGRNGSVGGEILKRFNIIMDYKNSKMTLKKNSNFKKEFSYNKSGIEVENRGIRLVTEYDSNYNYDLKNNTKIKIKGISKYIIKKAFTISNVRPNSSSARVGLQRGDVIIKINGNDTLDYSFQELINKFFGKTGDEINLVVYRFGREIKFSFKLESLIK